MKFFPYEISYLKYASLHAILPLGVGSANVCNISEQNQNNVELAPRLPVVPGLKGGDHHAGGRLPIRRFKTETLREGRRIKPGV